MMSFYTPPKDFARLGKIVMFSPKDLADFGESSVFLCDTKKSTKNPQFLSGIYFENQLENIPQNHSQNLQKHSTKIKSANIDLSQCEVCQDEKKDEKDGKKDCKYDKEWDIFKQTKEWLDLYFAGEGLPPLPPIVLKGSSFRLSVWQELLKIPYASTTTYGALATKIATLKQMPKISAQAIGGAIGQNPISILIPCHRVIGANGDLVGYASGCEKKKILLDFEARHKAT